MGETAEQKAIEWTPRSKCSVDRTVKGLQRGIWKSSGSPGYQAPGTPDTGFLCSFLWEGTGRGSGLHGCSYLFVATFVHQQILCKSSLFAYPPVAEGSALWSHKSTSSDRRELTKKCSIWCEGSSGYMGLMAGEESKSWMTRYAKLQKFKCIGVVFSLLLGWLSF